MVGEPKEIRPLIIKVERPTSGQKPAMIDVETHSKLKAVSIRTGIPMTKLIAISVDFAMEHMVIEGEVTDS